MIILSKLADKIFPWRYTRTQNLGQKYGGVWKYKSKNENGTPTGIGYAFEDLTKIRLEKQGHKVNQVPTMKNGADFIVDGELCQLKCGVNPYTTGRSFYQKQYGSYRYKGQTAVVPKGHKEGANIIFNMRNKNGLGKPHKVIESPVTRKEATAYCTRGIESLKMDLSDKNLRNISIRFGTVVAITGGAIELVSKWKKVDNKQKVLIGLKWLGIGTLSFLYEFARRQQSLRPSKIC